MQTPSKEGDDIATQHIARPVPVHDTKSTNGKRGTEKEGIELLFKSRRKQID